MDLLSFSSAVPCIPARRGGRRPEGQADWAYRGEQVGREVRDHPDEAQRGAGHLHQGCPLQGSLHPDVRLAGSGQDGGGGVHVQEMGLQWNP